MKSLWSALIDNMLTKNSSETSSAITEEDINAIAAKVLEDIPPYELTDADREQIANKVLEDIPPYELTDTDREQIANKVLEDIPPYELTDSDKEQIANKVLEDIPAYELTDSDKEDIVSTVIESLPEAPGSSASSEGTLEYINTVTLTQNSTLVSITTDSNGQPFSLKKAVIFMRITTSGSSSANLHTLVGFDPDADFGSDPASYKVCTMTGILNKDKPAKTAASMTIQALEDAGENGTRIVLFQGAPNNVGYSFSNVPEGVTGFCKVGVSSSNSSVYIAAGSQIKFYGIRA
ncbi:MAG: hypothetical protein E7675_06370 [Ruminococcaceae bacterium]|nr:hypothetical protein [Oscillospiraceae bacterium]